jgi:undecaprenyl-diphosphatase
MRIARGVILPLLGAAVTLLAAMTLLGLLVVHVLAHSSIGANEQSWDASLATGRTAWWNEATTVSSGLAATETIVILALIATAICSAIWRRWHEPVFIAVAVLGEVLIFTTTTLLVHRARPDLAMDSAPPTSSFPSGHVAAATAFYGAVAVLVWTAAQRRWLAAMALAFAIAIPVAVAWSRVYRGMHYPSDVVAGALLGLMWLWVTKRTLLPASGGLGE